MNYDDKLMLLFLERGYADMGDDTDEEDTVIQHVFKKTFENDGSAKKDNVSDYSDILEVQSESEVLMKPGRCILIFRQPLEDDEDMCDYNIRAFNTSATIFSAIDIMFLSAQELYDHFDMIEEKAQKSLQFMQDNI